MKFLNKISKGFILSLAIAYFTTSVIFGQSSQQAISQQNIIDTSSRPAVFAPGIVSTPFEEAGASFTPDGNTVYFLQGTIHYAVCFSKKVNGVWAKPKVAPFSGQWRDWDPFLSPDGKRLVFVSSRPLEAALQAKSKKYSHLWYADHLEGDNWSAPHLLNTTFNLDSTNNYAPTVSNSGTLFFCSNNRDGHKGMSSYSAKWLGDHYDTPKLLALNGEGEVMDPYVSPDESYIIFVGGDDLYISFRQGDSWGPGQKLPSNVNSGDSKSDPTVSPDGKMLYYSSNRVKGLYKRSDPNKAFNYDEFLTEMQGIFNGRTNILMIPINIPRAAH